MKKKNSNFMPETQDAARILLDRISLNETVDLARTLCGIYSPLGKEGELGHTIKTWFEERGINAQLDEVDQDRFNVIARIKGNGTGPSLMLTGHLDTYRLMGEWSVEPFAGVVRDGRIYGLGIRDMKGGLTAMAIAAHAVQSAGISLAGDLVIAFVVGHAEPGLGTRALCGDVKADVAIMAEPTNLNIVLAHHGWMNINITARGKIAHTTKADQGVSAIEKMAKVVLALQKMRFKPIQRSSAMHRLFPGPVCYKNIGLIKGGVAPNRVAPECLATMDVRYAYGKRPEDIIDEVVGRIDRIQKLDPDTDANVEMGFCLPAYMIHESSPYVHLMQNVIKEAIGQIPEILTRTYTTDAGMLQEDGGIPTVICGPADWPYKFADESLPVDDLTAAARIYALATLQVAGCPWTEFKVSGA